MPWRIQRQADALIKDLQDNNFGYALPKIYGADIDKVNELRESRIRSLGVLW
jgi:hypothetical protein